MQQFIFGIKNSFHRNACHSVSYIFMVLLSFPAYSMAQQSPGYQELIRSIQAEEVKFPFPQKDTTIVVGEIDASGDKPSVKFLLPYTGVRHIIHRGFPETDIVGRKGKPVVVMVGAQNITDTDRAVINAGNYFHLNLVFNIVRWTSASPTMMLSVGSITKLLKKEDARVVRINDVLDIDPAVVCYYPTTEVSVKDIDGRPENFFFNILHIKWNVAGAGILTLPVFPVKVIYMPVQDAKKSNTSSISNTTAQGYATGVSITTSSSMSKPVPTALADYGQFLDFLSMIGQQMAKDPDPEQHAIGEAISTISNVIKAGMGSQAISRSVINSETNIAQTSESTVEVDKKTVKSGVGGPGVGDVIAFYKNAKLVWVAYKGQLKLMLLGFNPELKTPSVLELKTALRSLTGRPEGTRDAIWNIDAKSISALLALDPFAGPNGAYTQADPNRFAITKKQDGSDAYYQIGGVGQMVSVTHTVSMSDTYSYAKVTTDLEVDKPGFLSFLGGPEEEKTVELIYSKSISSKFSDAQTISAGYELNGDGETDHYHCQVLFDKVFGTFAFRDPSLELNDINAISGTVVTARKKILTKTKVYLRAGEQVFSATSDNKGAFQFLLPYNQLMGAMLLYSGSDTVKLNWQGKPISKVSFVKRNP